MRIIALRSLIFLLIIVLPPALSAIVTYDWDITYVNTNPDGLFERRAIGVNNVYPPPPIEVSYNDTLVINLHNSIDTPTSLHSHGLFQNGTGFMDGPVMVTQCGIPPGDNFTYTIPIQQHGTYWIHAHNSGQYVDGLRAPLIIHAQTEPYTYDQEYTVTLADWYHDEHDVNLAAYLNPNNPTGGEPVPDSGLINNNPNNSTLAFVPGKVYRLRIINMSAFAMFFFAIDGHNMDIIEIDGVDVARTTVTGFAITAAQRYSVLVTALNDTSQNFAIHANMDVTMFDPSRTGAINPNLNATIVYSPNSPLFVNASSDPPLEAFDDTILKPLVAIATAPPDISIVLNASFAVLSDGVNRALFNGGTYVAPKVPTLMSVVSMGGNATNAAIYGNVNPFVVDHLAMVELAINNLDVGSHPFHFHGHQFQILGRSDQAYDPSNPFPEQANPTRRDTVHIPPGGHVLLRFRADNPGVWLFHCHIEWHFQAGLAATFISAPDLIQQQLTPNPTLLSQCAAQGIATTGNAAGNQGLDLTGLPARPELLPGTFTTKGIIALVATIVSACLGLGGVVWYAWGG